ncbi:uncharacterized protein LOC127241572 isoform X2 [Andrographis paniculata]|uniref:uncharacterized protein LOC127241572 isoform X2 n=1 Tax=Andrographis paniculata TaxID=175694 RepID=UPI0021E86F08|nr:uncharacterized protein LOC127241572 isoform X2 [Andrographis paniculata]
MELELELESESDKVVDTEGREPSDMGGQIQSKTPCPQTSTSTTTVDDDDNDDDDTVGALSKPPRELEPNSGNEIEKLNRSPISSAEAEEIIKVLKDVKRQNLVTHRLLTALIVVTLVWQLSEVSLILKIKEGFSNPLKSLGGMIKSFLPIPKPNQGAPAIDPPSLPAPPSIKIPELPYLELPGGFHTSDDDD